MWRGAISFGMVAIPVRLYLATESKSVSFRMLCPDDHTPIRNKRWCPTEDKEIPWSSTVRGYEVGKDEFVEIDDSDLDNLPLPTSHTCEILEFCEDSEIEAGLYIKSAYYLEPEAVGVKPYYLLKAALGEDRQGGRRQDRVPRPRAPLPAGAAREGLDPQHAALARRDPRRRRAVPPRGGGEPEIHKRELDMAVMLVDNLSATFDPERYKDNYREALMAMVEAKVNDQPLERPSPERPSKVTDLMAALKASVEAAQKGERAEQPAGAKQAADVASRRTSRRRKAS